MNPKCGNCRFFVEGIGISTCHVDPPQIREMQHVVSYGSTTELVTRWPEVSAHQWCGEWESMDAGADMRHAKDVELKCAAGPWVEGEPPPHDTKFYLVKYKISDSPCVVYWSPVWKTFRPTYSFSDFPYNITHHAEIKFPASDATGKRQG